MKIVVGDITGLIKLVDVEDVEIERYGEQNRDLGVNSFSSNPSTHQITVCRRNGDIEHWEYGYNNNLKCTNMFQGIAEGGIQGFSSETQLLTISKSGLLSLQLNYSEGGSNFSLDVSDSWSPASVSPLEDINAVKNRRMELSSCDVWRGEEGELSKLVAGGLGVLPSLYSLDSESTITKTWASRHLTHDFLDLSIPTHPQAIKFNPTNENVFFVGSAFKHFLVYDVRDSSCRPTNYSPSSKTELFEPTEFGITCLSPSPDGLEVYGGDCGGNVCVMDIRTNKRRRTFPSSDGSIKDIQHIKLEDWRLGRRYDDEDFMEDGEMGVIGVVGMDRYLRIYSANEGDLSPRSIYLVNTLSSLTILPHDGVKVSSSSSKQLEDGEKEDEKKEGDDEVEEEEESDSEDSQDEEEEEESNEEEEEEEFFLNIVSYDDENDNQKKIQDEEEDDEYGGPEHKKRRRKWSFG